MSEDAWSSSEIPGAGREASIQALVDSYLTACASGDDSSIDALVAEHPDLAPDLELRLRDAEFVRCAVGRSSSAEMQPSLVTEDGRRARSRGGAREPAIPGYEVDSEIHRGGQGVVYLATQRSTQRQVAIKVLRRGMLANVADRARLEREAQVLGSLRHPNVVTVHDFGVMDGSCYLIMDYIAGESLDAHLKRRPLGVRETLRLFARICDAVNAAHLAGVIHRDLKPSNIRVDGRGEPHVLDFGLAKWTEADGFGEMTHTGEFVGSLPWAAPEQVAGSPTRIDTRTDVYALGVVGYQMLTGQFPYDVKDALPRVIEHIQHDSPVRPGARRSGVDDEAETIVLKCLAKERERRYQTAGEIARDLERYLAGEPIEAKRDSNAYLVRKMLLRYRVPVALTAFATLLLGASTIALWTMYQGKQREFERAEAALTREATSRARAERRTRDMQRVAGFQAEILQAIDPLEMGVQFKRQLRAELRAALERQRIGAWPEQRTRTPEEVAEALVDFDRLTDALHPADIARETMIGYVLDRAAASAASRFDNEPLISGELHRALAGAYKSMGALSAAEDHYRAALAARRSTFGEASAEAATARGELGRVLVLAGKLEEAERRLRTALLFWRGEQPAAVVELAQARNNLAALLRTTGRYDAAEELYAAALAELYGGSGDLRLLIATTRHNMADLHQARGEYGAAEQGFRESLELAREVLPPDDPEIALGLNDLAGVLWDQGDLEGAERLFRDAARIYRKRYGDNHPEVASTLASLAVIVREQDRFEEAEALQREALATLRHWYGDRHPDVATSLNNLGELLATRGDLNAGEEALREALQARVEIYGDEHPTVATVLNNLAMVAFRRGDMTVAEEHLRAALTIDRKLHGDGHPDVILGLSNLGSLQMRREDLASARATLGEALAIAEQIEDRQQIVMCRANLAACLVRAEEFAAAEEQLRAAWAMIESDDLSLPLTERVRAGFVALYESWREADPTGGHDDQAAQWRSEVKPDSAEAAPE